MLYSEDTIGEHEGRCLCCKAVVPIEHLAPVIVGDGEEMEPWCDVCRTGYQEKA